MFFKHINNKLQTYRWWRENLLNNRTSTEQTETTTDKYTFTLGSTPNITEQAGGMTVTAGPVTLDA